MRIGVKTFVLFVVMLAMMLAYCPVPQTQAWGFFAHRKINRLAVFTLPPEMIGFYKKHIDFITEHAVDPDKRRYAAEGEAPRHYIDIDHYAPKGEDPFKVMPRKWNDAVAKFTEDTLKAYGIVPWHIPIMVARLRKAFINKDEEAILRISSELGHYVGDSHVPLHTTLNYNGQLTNQKGIHGFWESRLPELYHKEYDFLVGRAEYVKSPLNLAWETVEASHWAKDSVLDFELVLTKEFPSDNKYAFENRGTVLMKQYSRDFSRAYHDKLGGMVERRMRKSILTIGSLWYTAWVDAGQPDLSELSKRKVNKRNKKDDELDVHVKSGKIKGRKHE